MSSKPPRDSQRHTLRGQLVVLCAALAVPLLLLQIWWGYHDYQGAREEAWADALAFADAVDVMVWQFVDQSGDLLRSSAERSGLEWVSNGECSEDLESLHGVLHFDNVLVMEADGSILCSVAPVPPDADARDWPWYQDWAGEFTLAAPVQADFTDSWVVPLVSPIRAESGELRGALVGTLPLMELSRLLGEFRPDEDRLITLSTADSVIIARSLDAESSLGRRLPPSSGSDRLVAPGRWVAEGPDLNGIPRTWGQVRTDLGWMVYVGLPDAVVLGPALSEAAAHVGGTLAVVLLGLLLAAWSYVRIVRALRELADRAKATEEGIAIAVPPETPQEIAEVMEQLNETLKGRSRAESAERTVRRRYESLFDNAVFGIYISTADGRFLQVNPALVEMLGYESEEALLDAGPLALYPDPEMRRKLIESTLATGETATTTHELEWLKADGTPIVVRVGGHVRSGPQDEPVFEMIVQDITEERRTEDQLRQTQKMEAIGQLAGGVAHDFNNILTVISGNVELLEDDLPEEDPLRADLDQIAKATQRASSLTRRLLTFSRPSREGVRVVDVNEVVSELSRMLVPLIGETVTLTTELSEAPCKVVIDPGELEQLVVNLVLNARDAIGDHGEIEIGSGLESREVDAVVHEGVMLWVTDDGIGMDQATQRRIFEPFFTTKPMGEGTGLGLASVYGILQRVGGEVDVDSEPGRGTTMRIWIPALLDTEIIAPPAPPLDVARGDETILVVEDDELVRAFVGRALRVGGFDVHLTASGTEALEYLRNRTDPVDLVLSDVVMPGLSGPELAERLAIEAPHTPVLFMSGYIDNPFFDEELQKNPESLLRKPFTLHELQDRVRRTLDRGAQATTAG